MPFNRVSTVDEGGVKIYDECNLVILSHFEILEHHQYKHDFAPAPLYRLVTAVTDEGEEQTTREITWERPILHVKIKVGEKVMDVVNLHLKSKIPTDIPGQKPDDYTWRTSSSWAEGFFLSSVKRVG